MQRVVTGTLVFVLDSKNARFLNLACGHVFASGYVDSPLTFTCCHGDVNYCTLRMGTEASFIS